MLQIPLHNSVNAQPISRLYMNEISVSDLNEKKHSFIVFTEFSLAE